MAKTQKLMVMVERELIILDSSDDENNNKEAANNNKGKEEEQTVVSQSQPQFQSRNRSEYVNKIIAEETKMLADLSSFPNVSAMFAAEINMKKASRNKNKKRKKMNKDEGGNDDSGIVPSESGAIEILTSDEPEPIPEPVHEPVHESIPEPVHEPVHEPVPEPEPEKKEEENIVEAKLEESKVVTNCISEAQTVTESFINNLQPHMECIDNCIETKEPLVDEKSNEEQNNLIHDIASKSSKSKRKKAWSNDMEILEDLSAFPELVDMFAAEANMRKKSKRSNQLQNMENNLSQANEKDTEQEQVITINTETRIELESQINSHCSIVQIDSVTPNVLLIHDTGKDALVESEMQSNNQMCQVTPNVLLNINNKGKACKSLAKVTFIENTDSINEEKNMVLQNLLRPPRYFSPEVTELVTCNICEEGDHVTSQCTKSKRKKPCSICAHPDHQWKQCRKFTACIVCNEKGHLAKNCRRKNKNMEGKPKACLKCGGLGHDMFSCNNTYSDDDLKNIKCFVCNKFGHLCCFVTESTLKVSCYTCGVSGHSGSEHPEYARKQRNLELASKAEEEKHSDVQQVHNIKVEEQGTSRTSPSKMFKPYNGQKQTHNNTSQGWQRNRFVWVREEQTQPKV